MQRKFAQLQSIKTNEQSLISYVKDSLASQKCDCAGILSRPFLSTETTDVNNASRSSMAGGM